MLEANPDLAQQVRANNATAVVVWANAVKAGKMSREKFDKTVDLEVRVGRMDPADAEAARATLDG
jgi:ribosomal protein L1